MIRNRWSYLHRLYYGIMPPVIDLHVIDPYVPRWKQDQKEFTVSVAYHEHRGYQSYIPRPIMEMLGSPFIINTKRVEVEAAN